MKEALFPEARDPRWWSGGLRPHHERPFHWIAAAIVVLMLSGWSVAIADTWHARADRSAPEGAATGNAVTEAHLEKPQPVSGSVTDALLHPRASNTVYISEAMLAAFEPLQGTSGKVKVAFRLPGEEIAPGQDDRLTARFESGTTVVTSPEGQAPDRPGVYKLKVQLDQVQKAMGIDVVTLVPFSQKRQGRIGTYQLGSWPYERGGKPNSPRYAPPAGFIEVTRQNRQLWVSEHFQLGDFLTKGQQNVWPKYLLLDPKLLDKLELILADLKSRGHDIRNVEVMSGFRTPTYNESGGNTQGRANLSRHMYGDAADVFVDNDRNGVMDDLNRNGRSDTGDAEVVAEAAERVEKKYPELVGGIGIYKACCGHGPFTHVDVRGSRARWR